MARSPARTLQVRRWQRGEWSDPEDAVAAEEPLQVLVDGVEWAVVMRTPGQDVELAIGLLLAEGVVRSFADVDKVLVSAEAGEEPRARVHPDLLESNAVDVRLRVPVGAALPRRTLASNSECGICGATALEDLDRDLAVLDDATRFDPALVAELPDRLRRAQDVFDRTGGLHAAGLFDAAGELLVAREDVGRHNAVDRVAGWALERDRLPLRGHALAVSGRVGFEVAQKAVAAGIPLLVAVGAPTSLAVDLGRRFGLTIAAFVRDGRFNVYSAPQRLN